MEWLEFFSVLLFVGVNVIIGWWKCFLMCEVRILIMFWCYLGWYIVSLLGSVLWLCFSFLYRVRVLICIFCLIFFCVWFSVLSLFVSMCVLLMLLYNNSVILMDILFSCLAVLRCGFSVKFKLLAVSFCVLWFVILSSVLIFGWYFLVWMWFIFC